MLSHREICLDNFIVSDTALSTAVVIEADGLSKVLIKGKNRKLKMLTVGNLSRTKGRQK